MFPNKAAAARYWAAHPNSPLNPNRSPGSGGAWGPDGKVISPSKAPKKPGKNKTTKPGRANINAFLASIRSQDPTSTGIPFNPLAGMPGQETLDPFPFMEGSLPDGSDIKNVNSPAAKYGKASLLDPVKFADLMGRKSYQPVIDSLSQERAGLEGGVGQANSMIDSSYGDAAKGAAAGGASILAATAQGKQSLTDLAARMAAVAGGDPTAAAALGASSAQAQTEM